MSTWDEFLSSAKKAFNKAAVKVNDFADTAADSIKIESLKLKLCEKYEQLGKIVYNEMKSDAEVASAEKAAEKATEIDAIHAEIAVLKERINKRKGDKCASEEVKEEKDAEPKEPLALPESVEAKKDEVTE